MSNKAYNRKYFQDNREKHYELAERFHEKNPGKRWDYSLRSKFGITAQDYERMFNEQRGCCAICKIHQNAFPKDPKGRQRRLAVDHCHKTGKVRGLLCLKCNAGIGSLNEKPGNFLAALAYLYKSKTNNELGDLAQNYKGEVNGR